MRNILPFAFAGALLTGGTLPSTYAAIGLDSERPLVIFRPGGASGNGLVNVDLGGGNVLDASVGDRLLDANVSVDGSGDPLDADVNTLIGAAGSNTKIGGLSTVGISLTVGSTGSGDVDSGGADGDLGGPIKVHGQYALPDGGSNGNGSICVGHSADSLARLINSTRLDASWTRASNVSITPVMVCPEVKVWLSGQLAGSRPGSTLRNAVQADALISTALNRSSYGTERVLAVQKSGSQLTVFVY